MDKFLLSILPKLETRQCGKCKGQGCDLNDSCWNGQTLTKRGQEAEAKLIELTTIAVEDVKPGDKVYMPNYGWCVAYDLKKVCREGLNPQYAVVGLADDGEELELAYRFETQRLRLALTRAQKERIAEQVIDFQKSLDRSGNPKATG